MYVYVTCVICFMYMDFLCLKYYLSVPEGIFILKLAMVTFTVKLSSKRFI